MNIIFNIKFTSLARNVFQKSFFESTGLLKKTKKIPVNYTRISSYSGLVGKAFVRRDHHRGTGVSFRNCLGLSSTVKMTGGKVFERLPTNVTPINYKIVLKPDLKQLNFVGTTSVKVKVNQESSTVVLNALCLDIQSAEFVSELGAVQKASSVGISKEEERVTFSFQPPLQAGDGVIKIEYTGELNDKMKGFYRSKYKDANGEDKFAAVTQFEPTDARRAFPCWDEPAIKATFDVTLIAPKDLVALSNMGVVNSGPYEKDPSLKEVVYSTTPVMSTYLVAFIVGEFDFVEDFSSDGVRVRVYTPVGKQKQGKFALEVATKSLPFYKDYFNVAYPLPKLDLIAIADFASGAMENWGLVTYRETCLLVDPENTSAIRKQWIALTVSHELAHQWFGNLVTMEWWTYLWLNEGFASFIEFLCVHHLFPEYDIWTQFLTDVYTQALELDALHNSHPIEVPVSHPDEIDEIFDNISYNKGASVIRMLHKYIGNENFRAGMHKYLTKHAYKNTVTEDLWLSLGEASKMPVDAVMNTWVKQKGFPVITVSSRQDGNNRILSFSQKKFCADGKPDADSCRWMVPIGISVANSPAEVTKQILLETPSLEVVLEDVPADSWVKVNLGTIGFYITQYSVEMLDLFMPAIKDKSLPPLDRLGLQNDLFSLVQSGLKPTTEVLKLMNAYINETNYTVWSSITSCLGKLNQLLSHTDYQPQFHMYGRKLLSNIYAQLGWEAMPGESHLDTLLRGLILNGLCAFQDERIINEAAKRLEAHMNGTSIIPADLRAAVYKGAACIADDKIFNSLLKIYREADLHEEKNRASRALGSVSDPRLIQSVLEFALSEEVRSQDAVFVVMAVSLTKPGRDLAWSFFKSKKDEFRTRYEGGFLISRLVKYLTENFASEKKAQEVEAFFAENPFPGTERTIQQSLENIRLNAKWLERDSEQMKAFFTSCSG